MLKYSFLLPDCTLRLCIEVSRRRGRKIHRTKSLTSHLRVNPVDRVSQYSLGVPVKLHWVQGHASRSRATASSFCVEELKSLTRRSMVTGSDSIEASRIHRGYVVTHCLKVCAEKWGWRLIMEGGASLAVIAVLMIIHTWTHTQTQV